MPGAPVQVVKEWAYPEDEYDDTDEDQDEASDHDAEEDYADGGTISPPSLPAVRAGVGRHRPRRVRPARSRRRLRQHHRWHQGRGRERGGGRARRQERRRVIANIQAWASAETVRREGLAGCVAHKSAPKGAEALVCEAV